ncbi:MAG: ferrous iron transport protein B, partial [Clostridiales bacterium]
LIGGGDDWELCIGEERYRAVADIASRVVKKSPLIKRHEFSRKLDAIVCQRVLALPIFMLVMCAIFYLSFGPVGSFIQGLFKLAFYQWLPQAAESALAAMGMGPSVTGLVIDGIIAGVGAVLVFLPQLMLLFFCLSLLEFSGYMARAAFITDKLLAGFGLSGMSFIPMVLGFGCSVPAIMSCGSLENKRERMVTMMVVPFMSCSARMPVYVLFAAAFFATHQTLVVISLYLLGVAVALLTTLVLSPRIMQGRKPVFLMEIPPYRKPVWHCVWRSLWVRTWDYISQAGTVILIASVVIWFFSNFNWHMQLTHSATSILAQLGVVMAPVFAPLGFGTWQMTVALISGFLTKEAVVSSLAVLYAGSMGIGGLGDVLGGLISPPAAYALMVFVLLYTPCVATLAAVYKGSSSWKFTAWMVVYQLAVAWLLSFVVYRIGLLLF